MPINHQYIELEVEDHSSMRAYTALPEDNSGSHAGILVFQEAFGVNGYIRDIANRFATLGYVAIHSDL